MRPSEYAPAEVGPRLRIIGRRSDGRHPAGSPVAFAETRDVPRAEPAARQPTLRVPGRAGRSVAGRFRSGVARGPWAASGRERDILNVPGTNGDNLGHDFGHVRRAPADLPAGRPRIAPANRAKPTGTRTQAPVRAHAYARHLYRPP